MVMAKTESLLRPAPEGKPHWGRIKLAKEIEPVPTNGRPQEDSDQSVKIPMPVAGCGSRRSSPERNTGLDLMTQHGRVYPTGIGLLPLL